MINAAQTKNIFSEMSIYRHFYENVKKQQLSSSRKESEIFGK